MPSRYSKNDLRILKLYASLERIAMNDDMESKELEEMKSNFTSFFAYLNKTGKKEKKRYLLDSIKSETFLRTTQVLEADLREIGIKKITDFKLNGESLLFRAMSIKKGNGLRKDILEDIIINLIENFPDLITLEQFHKSNESTGVTPIHLAVVQENPELLHLMAKSIENSFKGAIKNATGEKFQGTVMMAGSLLGIASLKCNEKIFSIILEKFDHEMDVTNEKGDNIIHSLIKYACFQPDKLDSVLNMLRYIISCKFLPIESGKQKNKIRNVCGFYVENDSKYRKQVGKLLMMKNREKLTPLQLATKRQQFKIFEIILNDEVCLFFIFLNTLNNINYANVNKYAMLTRRFLFAFLFGAFKGTVIFTGIETFFVYLSQESNDGIFQRNQYDITEIETLALKSDVKGADNEDIKDENHESVLEFVLHHQTANAFLFSNVTPLKEIIKEKWNHYKKWIYGSFALYLVFLVLLSISAVYRSHLKETVNKNDTAQFLYCVTKNGFVTFVSVLGLIFDIIVIVIIITKFMLGIGELDILFQARKPTLAVLVFLLFVLLTTILLLNALIAMMSNTCTDLMNNHTGYSASKMHYRLQKLALIVFLESFLHNGSLKRVGETRHNINRYDNEVQKFVKKDRLFWTQSFVKEDVETAIEPSDEQLQHIDRTTILKNELIETIKQGQGQLPKVKRPKNAKRKVSDILAFPSELQTVQKRLDIKDYEQRQCGRCMDETVTCLQSQEIKEVTEFI
ncbi:uncharacterized protein LOC132737635 [Ruditapes philippinarum]|uniref:uncharacterized protein LOC132737635 n=1 Tax=Ruditapes philippinarum TaxID=129788 RepID=UPI00295AC95D|nr:uncharacterized protein LOC132737635 [Ruditapes philippinarum]